MNRTLDLRRHPSRKADRAPQGGRALCELTLDIRRGPPRIVGETVCGRRLLLGSDPACDVRLDPSEAPELHSLVHADRDSVWIEAVVSEPALLVNGAPTEWTRLRDGDVVQIGSLECLVRLGAAAIPATVEVDRSRSARRGRALRIAPSGASHAAALSADELATRIDKEEEMVERFDAGLHLGLRALLAAARRQSDATASEADTDECCEGIDAPAVVRWDAGQAEFARARPHRPATDAAWDRAGTVALARQLGQLASRIEKRLQDDEWPAALNLGEALARAAGELQVIHDRLSEPATRDVVRPERIAA